MVSECVQIIDENGDFVVDMSDVIQRWGVPDSDTKYNFVTAIGPQSSGQSTLLDQLFGTIFGANIHHDTNKQQLTKGIWLCPAKGTNTIVANVGDMRQEDQDQDIHLKRVSALFSISISHVVMISLLENQANHLNGSMEDFLKTILSSLLFWITTVHGGRLDRRILVLFIIRDSISGARKATLVKDIERSMGNLSESLSKSHCKMSDFVQLAFTTLPQNTRGSKYDEEVHQLRRQFMNRNQMSYFFQHANDNNSPSPKMMATGMKKGWEDLRCHQTIQDISRMLEWHEKLLSSFNGNKYAGPPKKEYKNCAIQASLADSGLQSGLPLLTLLGILKNRQADDVGSVVNLVTLGLMHEVLSRKNYLNVSSELNLASDVQNLMDFIFYLLDHGHLSNMDMPDANRRARRLILKIIRKTPVFPKSLLLSAVTANIDRDCIGKGGFSYVFKGKFRGSPVALKMLVNKRRDYDFCREALIWRSLSHESVHSFLGIYENGPSLQFLVSPYMKNGTLSQWRTGLNPSVVETQKRVLEVAEGVQYIHSEGIVHGDLRGDNVLLDSDFHAKITDFGLTRHSEATVTRTGSFCSPFAAPELFGSEDDEFSEDEDDRRQARTQKSDIYAFGCLYYETHFGVLPFANANEITIMRQVTNGERPPRLERPAMSDKAWKLINRCWRREPMRRPAMENIVETMMTWKAA